MLDENISDLIGRIYDSVGDLRQWDLVVAQLVTTLDVKGGFQTITDVRQQVVVPNSFIGQGSRHLQDGLIDYAEGMYKIDPSLAWGLRYPEGRFFDTSEVFSPDQIAEHEFFRWNQAECFGSAHWLLGYTPPIDGLTFGLSVHSSAEEGPLGEEKKALFKMLFDHLEHAVRLWARPPLFADTSECIIMVDAAGKVRQISPAAEALLTQSDGLSIQAGQLQAWNSETTRRLRAAIQSALSALVDGGAGGAVSLPRPSGKGDLLVTVTPLLNLPSPFGAFRPAALVKIIDPERQLTPTAVKLWIELFSLTPAEARFAEALVGGDQSVRHVADAMGISYATARVHLRHLLEKTETHSQAQLAVLLARLAGG